MKKLLLLFSFSIFLLSCTKQEQASIVGGWLEVAAYAERSGQYSWGSPSRFPLSLRFTEDGKYSAHYDVSAGNGTYFYDHSNRQLQLESINQPPRIYSVTYINDHYMIIEYSTSYKLKFVRL